MPRSLRFQYPGAIYHVMARGDGGKVVFEDDSDRKGFLYRLGKVCESHGWRVHAWVLMGNHFHLLLETPEANLSSGMHVLLGAYSQGWNIRRARHGHVFQGRYKSIPVNSSESDPYYFRVVANYIHLNPARAGLAGGEKGSLLGYSWSSLPCHASGKGPEWLDTDRLLWAFELAGDGRGRRAYVAWLEARAANEGGKIDEAAMQELRRGWYLGKPDFRERLLQLFEKPTVPSKGPAGLPKAHCETEAERLASAALLTLGLPQDRPALAARRKGEPAKVLVATLLRQCTAVGNAWLAERLAMGHPGSVSRLIAACQRDPAAMLEVERLQELLKCKA